MSKTLQNLIDLADDFLARFHFEVGDEAATREVELFMDNRNALFQQFVDAGGAGEGERSLLEQLVARDEVVRQRLEDACSRIHGGLAHLRNGRKALKCYRVQGQGIRSRIKG